VHEERLGKQWTLWWGDAEVCSFGMRAEQGGVVNETLSASFTSVELSSIYLSIYLRSFLSEPFSTCTTNMYM